MCQQAYVNMILQTGVRYLRLRSSVLFFFFQAEDGIRDLTVTGVQTCALPISCRHRLARLTGGLRSLGLAAAERAQDLRSRPVRQAIETQQQRPPARGESLRDPARDPVELRNTALRHGAEERERHVQARHRHRTAAAGSDALAGGVSQRAALLRVRPQREEQPPRRFARGRGWGLPLGRRARLSAAPPTPSLRVLASPPTGTSSPRHDPPRI